MINIMIMLLISCCNIVCADEFACILNNKYMENLFLDAEIYFRGSQVRPIKDIRGFVLRLNFENPENNFNEFEKDICQSIQLIKVFLAKIKNPVIIEVHTSEIPKKYKKMKNWEFSTVIANKLEKLFLQKEAKIELNRIKSVGYGEFMPAGENTSNNGGNSSNRIDIIVLCSEDGE